MTGKITRRLAVVGLAGLLAGCATGQSFQEVAQVLPSLKQGQGRIYFVRRAEYQGAAIQPDIRLNGVVVGSSQPGGFFFVDRPPGDYTVATSTEVTNSVDFRLSAGETKYIKTSISMGLLVGHVVPTLEYPEQGQSDVRQLKYIGRALAESR